MLSAARMSATSACSDGGKSVFTKTSLPLGDKKSVIIVLVTFMFRAIEQLYWHEASPILLRIAALLDSGLLGIACPSSSSVPCLPLVEAWLAVRPCWRQLKPTQQRPRRRRLPALRSCQFSRPKREQVRLLKQQVGSAAEDSDEVLEEGILLPWSPSATVSAASLLHAAAAVVQGHEHEVKRLQR